MNISDMADALALSMGIKIVELPFVEPGKAFLFRKPMPLEFKIQEPEYKPERFAFGLYGTFKVPCPAGIIMCCDFCDPMPQAKARKWHRKYRGPRRKLRRIRPNPRDQRAGVVKP